MAKRVLYPHTAQTPEMKLRAEMRAKSSPELRRLCNSKETPQAEKQMAREVLFERGQRE